MIFRYFFGWKWNMIFNWEKNLFWTNKKFVYLIFIPKYRTKGHEQMLHNSKKRVSVKIGHFNLKWTNVCSKVFHWKSVKLMILSLSRKIWENFPPCNGDRHLLVIVSSVIKGCRKIGKPNGVYESWWDNALFETGRPVVPLSRDEGRSKNPGTTPLSQDKMNFYLSNCTKLFQKKRPDFLFWNVLFLF